MAFLRSALGQEPHPLIRTERVLLRPPLMSDYAAWAELRGMSREHLTRWEPRWASDELSRTAYRRRIRHYQRDAREDQGYAFFLFVGRDERMVGGLTLSNVRRGVTQAAVVGYWLGARHVGKGYMTEAVRGALRFSFSGLGLHRVEAATMPANAASLRVLERAGFVREGLARRYLKIDGTWQDHILLACLSDDAPAAQGGLA